MIEMHDLEFSGSGLIHDPESGKREKIEFSAPIRSAQVIITLGEYLAGWGSMYPRININEVMLAVEEENVVVSAFGELPLYKSHVFEQSVKK
jgi:hypothetical protein